MVPTHLVGWEKTPQATLPTSCRTLDLWPQERRTSLQSMALTTTRLMALVRLFIDNDHNQHTIDSIAVEIWIMNLYILPNNNNLNLPRLLGVSSNHPTLFVHMQRCYNCMYAWITTTSGKWIMAYLLNLR